MSALTQKTALVFGVATARQMQVLRAIGDHLSGFGFPPTIREIGNHVGILSTNGVSDHLAALEKKGLLTRNPSQARAIRVTDLGRRALAEVSP